MSFRRTSGISLVELLCVVAVLLILVSLLSPTLQRSRKAAYISEDISRLRQLGVARQIYVENHGGTVLSPRLLYETGSIPLTLIQSRNDATREGMLRAFSNQSVIQPSDPVWIDPNLGRISAVGPRDVSVDSSLLQLENVERAGWAAFIVSDGIRNRATLLEEWSQGIRALRLRFDTSVAPTTAQVRRITPEDLAEMPELNADTMICYALDLFIDPQDRGKIGR